MRKDITFKAKSINVSGKWIPSGTVYFHNVVSTVRRDVKYKNIEMPTKEKADEYFYSKTLVKYTKLAPFN